VKRGLLVVLAGGVALRLALVAAGGPPERFEYDALARNLISGRGFVYDQLGTPYRSFYAGLGYVAVNAGVDWLFPNQPKAMPVAQSLYAALLGWVVFHMARRLFDERLAIASAALTMLHPALVYYDTRKLHPLGFDSLAMMLALWLLLRLRDDRRAAAFVASGAAMGLAILQRGSMALFAVFGVLWLLRIPRTAARRIALYVAGVLVVLTPWAARNYAIHRMLMLESMTPQQFWKGNAAYSNGSGYLPSGRNVYDAAPEQLVHAWQRRDETGQARLFRDEAIAQVQRDPARAAELDVKKAIYFWTAPPDSGQQYPPQYFAVYFAYYGAVLCLAVVGIAMVLRDPVLAPEATLVVLYLASLTLVHVVMFVEMRHRWAAEPVLLVFVPAGARVVWNTVSRRSSR